MYIYIYIVMYNVYNICVYIYIEREREIYHMYVCMREFKAPGSRMIYKIARTADKRGGVLSTEILLPRIARRETVCQASTRGYVSSTNSNRTI